MKKCGEIWNTLSPEDRAKYDEMHDKDKVRYEE
jgi:HMG (high mobility group) box